MQRRRTSNIPYFERDVSSAHFSVVKCDSWDDILTPLQSERSPLDVIADRAERPTLTWPDPITFTNDVFPEA